MPISPLVRLSDQYQREAEWLIMQPLSESYANAVAYVKNIFQLWTVHPSYSETSLVWRNCWSICWFVLDPRCVMTLRYSFATLARALVCEFDVITFSRNFLVFATIKLLFGEAELHAGMVWGLSSSVGTVSLELLFRTFLCYDNCTGCHS